MKIIGISGKIGCGKTVLGRRLVELLGNGWVKVSFADVLKREVAGLFSIPLDWCYNAKDRLVDVIHQLAPAPKMTVREILQWWGTDVRRKEGTEYWNKQLLVVLLVLAVKGAKGAVIDDVRLPNEATLVRTLQGALVRLDMYPGYHQAAAGAEHITETALDDWTDWDYRNAPEFGQLDAEAMRIIEQFSVGGFFTKTNQPANGGLSPEELAAAHKKGHIVYRPKVKIENGKPVIRTHDAKGYVVENETGAIRRFKKRYRVSKKQRRKLKAAVKAEGRQVVPHRSGGGAPV